MRACVRVARTCVYVYVYVSVCVCARARAFVGLRACSVVFCRLFVSCLYLCVCVFFQNVDI